MRRDQIALSNILEESEDLAASQDLSDFIENENLIKRKLRGAQRKPTPRVVSNGRRTPNLLELVQTISTASNSDIVLPAIGQRYASNTTMIRKKSTPKMVSAKRHFELYGNGDYRTQMFLQMLQQTLGNEHYLLHDKLIKALKYFSNDHDLEKLFGKLVSILTDAQHEFIFHALRGFLPNATRPDYDALLEHHFSENRILSEHRIVNTSLELGDIKEEKPKSAPPKASKNDIEREIERTTQKLKQKKKPITSSRIEKMKFSEGQRRIRLQKADNEGFGFVIKGDKPVYVSSLKTNGAAERAGMHIGDCLLAVNDISIKHFDRERIISILLNSGENPVLTILESKKYEEDVERGTNGRLSRFDIEKLKTTCNRYSNHESIETLDNELISIVRELQPDRKILYKIMEKALPSQIAAILIKKIEHEIYKGDAVSNCSSAKFVKEMTKSRNRSLSASSTTDRISSGSSTGTRTTVRMENTASTVTLNHAGQSRKSKQISSHVTDDGVNYRTPECRKVSAKKTDSSTGRRKQWSKPAPNGYPFPSSTPGTHRSEDSLNPDTSRTVKMSEYDFGFQQRIVRFDEEPPKPPSPERKPPLKPQENSAIRRSIKTNIAPIINAAKARNYSILIAHLKLTPTDIVKAIANGSTGKLELAHLKTLLRNQPDDKECDMLLKRYEERAEMNEADQLAMNMINLSDYTLRLKCLIFKVEFDNRDIELKPAFDNLTRAANQSRKAKKFLKIVEFITEELKKTLDQPNLKFKASLLDQYNPTINGSIARTNLLSFIQIIEEKFPVLVDYENETPDVKSASKVNYASLRFEVQRHRNECNSLLYQIEQMRRQNANDKFQPQMKQYLTKADKLITNVEIAVQQSQRQYYACAQHYGENPTVMKTETFFGIFDQFNRNFNSLRQELNGLEL